MIPVPEGRLKRFHKRRVSFRRAYGTSMLFSLPATEVAGYYQRSLRDPRVARRAT